MEKIKSFVSKHPQWTSWIVLAIGMVAILVWSARDVGLLPGQWAALIIATILVAGLAVWIIGWEDEEEEEEPLEQAPEKRARKERTTKGLTSKVRGRLGGPKKTLEQRAEEPIEELVEEPAAKLAEDPADIEAPPLPPKEDATAS